ncbi:MAG: hypothetical protein SVY53_04675 [Chloroflexota bacterium]|nr:hypothetical protein [Chloroflexota bacterium]
MRAWDPREGNGLLVQETTSFLGGAVATWQPGTLGGGKVDSGQTGLVIGSDCLPYIHRLSRFARNDGNRVNGYAYVMCIAANGIIVNSLIEGEYRVDELYFR